MPKWPKVPLVRTQNYSQEYPKVHFRTTFQVKTISEPFSAIGADCGTSMLEHIVYDCYQTYKDINNLAQIIKRWRAISSNHTHTHINL